MNGSNAAATVAQDSLGKRQSQCSEQMRRVDIALNHLDEAVSMMSQRVASVTMPPGTPIGNSTKPQAVENLVPAASELASFDSRIRLATASLMDLIQRIEL